MYQRILVPIDGSPTAKAGLAEALKLARLSGGRLELLHVVDELSLAAGFDLYGAAIPEMIPQLKKLGERLLDEARAVAVAAGVPVETRLIDVLSGRIASLVADEAAAWGADLIVLGTHGRRGVRRFVLGSDAEQILRQSTVPVLLVRAAPGTAAPDDAVAVTEKAGAAQ